MSDPNPWKQGFWLVFNVAFAAYEIHIGNQFWAGVFSGMGSLNLAALLGMAAGELTWRLKSKQ